jgi:hypothetical protein
MARTGSCDHNARGEAFNEIALQINLPDGSGSVLVDCRYTWDGTSVWPACDGPVIYLQTRNTGTSPAWAMLPDKKRSPLWVQLDPGTDVTVTQKGTLSNLGLSAATDVRSVAFSFTNPAG